MSSFLSSFFAMLRTLECRGSLLCLFAGLDFFAQNAVPRICAFLAYQSYQNSNAPFNLQLLLASNTLNLTNQLECPFKKISLIAF